jgi:chemotaxis protein CheC
MSSEILNKYELDFLHYVLNSHIVDRTRFSLSSLLDEQFKHEIKSVHKQISEIEIMQKLRNDLILCSVFLRGEGEIRIGILYSIPEYDALRITAKLLCLDKIDSLDELGKSALSEVGNIMSGSFFNALSDHTGLKVELSTPDFAITSSTSILEPHASEFLNTQNDMVTQVELKGKDSGVVVHMLIIQDHDNARKLLNKKGYDV